MPKIGMEEWRNELERVLFRAGDEGLSVKEMAKTLKLGVGSVRRRLEALKESGRLVTGKKHILGLDDVMRVVTVYRIRGRK